MKNRQWIVILFDEEENTPSDSVLEVFGPFKSSDEAEAWSDDYWSKMSTEMQEFRGLTAHSICPIS